MLFSLGNQQQPQQLDLMFLLGLKPRSIILHIQHCLNVQYKALIQGP